MAEREWAGRWAGGSLPNDINNILYWVATAGRGRERSKEEGGRGERSERVGSWRGTKREMGERIFLVNQRDSVWRARGGGFVTGFSQNKIRKKDDREKADKNINSRIMREG